MKPSQRTDITVKIKINENAVIIIQCIYDDTLTRILLNLNKQVIIVLMDDSNVSSSKLPR